ncbi:MAG: hypothetical protein CTY14_02080 [Methylotenera sp.]|nr:MAG: hypothetical protein CTY14_02080 [Methylotenera sp.]
MSSKLLLNAAEKQTALWIKIKAHLEARLETCRKQNDGDADAVQTAKMRGRILEIKSFLALENTPPSLTKGLEESRPFE